MRSILISLALVMVLPAAPGAPASPPAVRGGLIPGGPVDEAVAYGSTESGHREIRLVQVSTGDDLGSVTPAGAGDVEPTWSPDGARLAFARKTAGTHGIHVMDAEGGVAARVTSGASEDRQPSWSPSGRIAFTRADPIRGTSRIMSVKTDGSGLTGITGRGPRNRRDASPAWAPEGSMLAFVRAQGGLPRLNVIGSDGNGRVELDPQPGCADANPSWSVAGIVFDRSCDGGLPDLYRVELVGGVWSAPTNLTNTVGVAEFDADWSPNGSGIVFSRHITASGNADLAIMQPLDAPAVPLASAPTSELGADWHGFGDGEGGGCTVLGTMGADTISAGPGNEVICALGGDDVIDGGQGSDILRGGGGRDTASFASSGSPVTASLATRTATSGPFADTLVEIENLTGSAQGDQLTGNGGTNVLDGRGQGDDLDGGGGTDTATYAAAAVGVAVDLTTGIASGGGGNDTLAGIENVIGSPHADTLTGSGANNVLSGGAGNDDLDGAGGTDTASFASSAGSVQASLDAGTATGEGDDDLAGIENVIGSSSDDSLTGDDGPNRLDGGAGGDTLAGLDGADLLIGGDGDDDLDGGGDHDRLRGDAGADALLGKDGDDDLEGGSAADDLAGGPGDDALTGGSGDDVLTGGSGGDRLIGDSGNDRAEGGDGGDRLSGGPGEDVVLGDAGGDVVSGDDGQDRVTGGSGSDRLSGGAGNDRLSARDRTRDRVNGGSGKDRGSFDRGRDAVASLESAKRSRRYRTRSSRVASGITLKKIRDRRGPRRIFVLSMAPGGGRATDTALAQNTLRGFERTSSMAKRHGAIAAVNGDFGLPSGRPAHHFSMDGDLKQTSEAYGYHYAMSADGARTFMGHREVALDSVVTRGERWDVARWNDGPPGTGEIGGVAATSGGLEASPGYVCSARLTPVQPNTMRWTEDGNGVQSEHAVQAVSCDETGLPVQGGIVLSARITTEEGAFIRGLEGSEVTLSWSMGWPGVLDMLGGYPQLVRAGKVVADSCNASLCKRHPRTGVGMRPDGTVLLVVVDGRRKRWSRGMTLKQFARQFERLGAVWALNLDGGGSSTMWIRGQGIVNRPSDRRERAVSSALLVLTGPDTGEPSVLSSGGQGEMAAPAQTPADRRAGSLSVEDPGSTGGLMEMLAEGVLDAPQTLTGELRLALERFRGSEP